MGKRKAEESATANEDRHFDPEVQSDGGDSGAEGEEGDEFEIERDEHGKLKGVRLNNSHVDVDALRNPFVRRHSTVMVEAGENSPKFIGYVRELVQQRRDVKVHICWFYRYFDLPEPHPRDMLISRARLGNRPEGGDRGRFKEIYFSNHCDKISVQSIMHHIKVWVLPDDSLEPAMIPVDPTKDQAAAAASGGGAKVPLPGFVCRRMYDPRAKALFPLSDVSSRGMDAWLVNDVSELMRASQVERDEFKAEWQQLRRLRAEAAAQQEQEDQQQTQEGE